MTVDPAALEGAGYPPLAPDLGEFKLASKARRSIQHHVERAYPEEACGFLLGPAPTGVANPRRITEALPSENVKEEHRTHRFLIPHQEVMRVEQEIAPSGRAVLGYYHSHPDHLAAPSSFDRDHAWPWYVYVVVGVRQGHMGDLNAFELDPEGGIFHTLSPEMPSKSTGQQEEEEPA